MEYLSTTWDVKYQAAVSEGEDIVERQSKRGEKVVKWFGSEGRKHLRMVHFTEIGGKRNGLLEVKEKYEIPMQSTFNFSIAFLHVANTVKRLK